MHVLGVDLADQTARAVVVTRDGAIVREAASASSDAAAAVRDAVKKVISDDVSAIGIAVEPGGPAGIASALGNVATIQSRIVAASSAAIAAEVWTGAAKGRRNAVCLLAGDRVLSGILLDGRPWAGAHGRGGAAGWLALNPVERQDYRKLGSLAAEVSSKGIARRLAWRIQAGDESAVLAQAGDLESITAAHVFQGARAGDGVAISVVRDTAKYIGMAVANFMTTLDPEVIVLGGTLAAAGDLLLDPVRHDCARWLPPYLMEHFRCEASPLGENGVAIGAARLALDDHP